MEQELRQLLSELCQLPTNFAKAADLYLDLGVPSVKALEILMALEDRYGVQIPDEQFVEAVSLEKLVAMMERLERVRTQ